MRRTSISNFRGGLEARRAGQGVAVACRVAYAKVMSQWKGGLRMFCEECHLTIFPSVSGAEAMVDFVSLRRRRRRRGRMKMGAFFVT